MPVEIDIAKVAKLARIALTEEELEMYGRQLGDILEHAEQVQALPTEDVEPTSHPLPMVNAFRPDIVTGSLPQRRSWSRRPPPRTAISGSPGSWTNRDRSRRPHDCRGETGSSGR